MVFSTAPTWSRTSTKSSTSGASRWVETHWRLSDPPVCQVSSKDPSSGAESLYAVGTRLFTLGAGGPSYDLSPLRDLIAWRDERNRA